MAAYTYETPQESMSLTPHGVVPSTKASQKKLEAQQAARRRGENVLTPVPQGYSVVPAPQQGQGRYGLVPGPIGLPDPHADLAKLYPNLDKSNAAASDAILSRLEGDLSPETIANIENAGATFGVTSGMPGSGMSRNLTARDIGLTTEQLQQQGLTDFGAILPMMAQTEAVSPALQSQIAEINAANAAMPNPRDASLYAKKLFDEYMQNLTNPGGGTGMFGMDSKTSGEIGQYAQLVGQLAMMFA